MGRYFFIKSNYSAISDWIIVATIYFIFFVLISSAFTASFILTEHSAY